MTGLGSTSSYVYGLGVDAQSDKKTVEKYSISGYLQSGPYLFDYIDVDPFYDMAFEGGDSYGDIWMACDDSTSPIKAFDTNGALTYAIYDTVIPAAHGLCFESDRYVWASNTYDDEIYRIDLEPVGVGGSSSSPVEGTATLKSSENPFQSSVVLSATGIETGRLEIFDLAGREVISEPFRGSFTWDGRSANGSPVEAGPYMARLTYGSGRSVSTKLLKL